MAPVHTWAGLLVGWVLFFVFVTGTLGYFDAEIDRWTRPELPRQDAVTAAESVQAAVAHLNRVAPEADRWFIAPPTQRERPNLYVFWERETHGESEAGRGYALLDVETAEPIEARDTDGAQTLYRMHYAMHYMPRIVGEYIVGICSMLMLIAIITGVVIHKKIFKDFFTFRPRKGQRSWLDFHNVLSVTALPFHLMITYSGLLFLAVTYMPLIVAGTYGVGSDGVRQFYDEAFPREDHAEPAGQPAALADLGSVVADAEGQWGARQVRSLSVYHPGDVNARVEVYRRIDNAVRRGDERVYDGVTGELLAAPAEQPSGVRTVRDVLLGLHEGLFAGPVLRWLYFLSGLMGTGMIATGLVLWTVKRRARQLARVTGPAFGHRVVEALNTGTVVGLPAALAAFFWANRLLPLEMDQRAEWELHVLFIVWALTMIWAATRPLMRGWTELCWLCALGWAAIPLISVLTTDRPLTRSISEGDWVFAGLELTALAIGMLFAAAAWYLERKHAPSPSRDKAGCRRANRQGAM